MLSAGDRARIATCVAEHDIRVQYGDAANPVRVGTVVEANRAGDNFRVVWDDDGLAAGFGDETWSDLRQYGWHILPTLPLGSTWPREPAARRCDVCSAELTAGEVARLELDVDFVEHGSPAHLIRSV